MWVARHERIEAGNESKAIFDDKNLEVRGPQEANRDLGVRQGRKEEMIQLLSRAAREERLSRRRRRKAIAVRTGYEPRCR